MCSARLDTVCYSDDWPDDEQKERDSSRGQIRKIESREGEQKYGMDSAAVGGHMTTQPTMHV